jgi:hypothetical protein
LFYGWASSERRFVFTLTIVFCSCSIGGLSSHASSFLILKDACSGDGTSFIPINPEAPLGTMITILYNMNPASVDTNTLAELMLYYFVSLINLFLERNFDTFSLELY